jgi:hypothetical protein
MMGGALGLAVLASLADSRSGSLLEDGESLASALTGGYHVAFVVGALFAAAAAGIGAGLLRNPSGPPPDMAESAVEREPAEAVA